MLPHQLLGRLNNIAGQRNPVEMRNDHPAAGAQHAIHFSGGLRAVEPMPALSGCNYVERSVVRRNRFSAPLEVRNRIDSGVRIQPLRFVKKRSRRVDCRDITSAARKTSCDGPRTRPKIQHSVTRMDETRRKHSLEKFIWKSGPVSAVIFGGLA